jgi:hypothetical protein
VAAAGASGGGQCCLPVLSSVWFRSFMHAPESLQWKAKQAIRPID